MGRIEEALRRAAAKKNVPEVPFVEQELPETPFASAWHSEPLPPTGPTPAANRLMRASDEADRTPSTSLGLEAGGRRQTASVRLESQLAMNWPQPFAEEVSNRLVIMPATDRSAVAQYRRLADALQQKQSETGAKTVMVGSAVAREGKTLTAVNLALTLSHVHGRRVLLIDADLAHPRIHHVFQVSAGAGLNRCLEPGGARKMPVIEVSSTLVLLPAGPAGAAVGALGSEQMRQLLAHAAESFDWIILDSAPVLHSADTRHLAAIVDLAFLVIDAGKTPRTAVAEAVEMLGADRLMGVVLNRAAD